MRMLVDEKQEKRLGSSQEVSKIFILKSLDFFIEENVVSLFHWALFVLTLILSVSVTDKKNQRTWETTFSSMKKSRDF